MLLRFLKAYDDGNLEVFGAILQQAENDPDLDTLIWATFPAYLREAEHIYPKEKEKLVAFLQQSLPSDWKTPEPLPLTLADIAARIHVELTLHRAEYVDSHALRRALNILVQSHDPLPLDLDLRTIHAIFLHYGLPIPPTFDKLFLKATRFLQEKRATQ